MIHKIGPFVGFDSNIYLLTGERNVLIDSGTGMCSGAVISAIREIVHSGTVGVLLLTHCHVDHVGGARSIVDEFGCEVFSGSSDAIHISEADSTYTLDSHFGISIDPVPVSPLKEGDVIDIGEHRLVVIDTPGHTEGGVSYYDEVTRSLFSGDTLFSVGVGRTDFPSGSMSSLSSSISKLSRLDIVALYPGHGNINTDDASSSVVQGLEMVGLR